MASIRAQLVKLASYKFAAGIATPPPVPPPVQNPLQSSGFPRALQPSMPLAKAPSAVAPMQPAMPQTSPGAPSIVQNTGVGAPSSLQR